MTKAENAAANPRVENGAAFEIDFADAWRPVLTLSVIAFAVLVAGIYLYARFGGPWVDRLSDEIGELVAARAAALEEAGQRDEAIDTYYQALELKFDDPMQRFWTSHRFVTILREEERYEEAVAVLQQALDRAGGEGQTYSMMDSALRKLERYEDTIANAEAWYAWAKQAGASEGMAWAKFWQGQSYRQLDQDEAALKALLASYEAHPMTVNALAAARALINQGRGEEALPMLEFCMQSGDDAAARDARALKKQIGETP